MIIRREILQNGRSVSRINGQMVNLSVLKAVGQHLVDIHGQHDQERTDAAPLHIAMLDEFGDAAFSKPKMLIVRPLKITNACANKWWNSSATSRENKARIEMLEFQIAEIEAAALEVDEDLHLEQERQRLLNHKMIADTLTNAHTMLDAEEFSSLSNVRSAMNDLESIEEYDPTYKELSSQLSETFYALEDITKRLEDVVDGLEFDGNRLMQVESRLDLIHSITRKYGGQVKDVLEYLAQITKEYSLLTGSDLSSEDMEKELKRLEKSLVILAQDLSDQRHTLAKLWKMKSSKNWQTSTWTRRASKCVQQV